MDPLDRKVSELPESLESLLASFLLPEIVSSQPRTVSERERKLIRGAGRYVIGAGKPVSYEENIFIGGLSRPYTVENMQAAAAAGYYNTAKHLFNELKDYPEARELLLVAAINSDDVANLEDYRSEIDVESDLSKMLTIAASSRGDKIFRRLYEELPQPRDPALVSQLLRVAVITNNLAVTEFLLREAGINFPIPDDLALRAIDTKNFELFKLIVEEGKFTPQVWREIVPRVIMGGRGIPEMFDYVAAATDLFSQERKDRDAMINAYIKIAGDYFNQYALKRLVEGVNEIEDIRYAAGVSDEQLHRLARGHLSPEIMDIVFTRGGDYKSFFPKMEQNRIMEVPMMIPEEEGIEYTNAFIDYAGQDAKLLGKGLRRIVEYPYLVEVFLRRGYKPTIVDVRAAVERGLPETIKLLTNPALGGVVGISNPSLWVNDLDTVKRFIDYGVIPPESTLQTSILEELFTDAVSARAVATINSVLPYVKDKESLLRRASNFRGKDLTQKLTSLGVTSDSTDPQSELNEAIKAKDLKRVVTTIGRGANVTANDNYAIKLAVITRAGVPILTELYKNGANIRAEQDYPLRGAIAADDLDAVKFLLREMKGVPADTFKMALDNDKEAILRYLLSVTVPTISELQSILDWAQRMGKTDIAAYVRGFGAR